MVAKDTGSRHWSASDGTKRNGNQKWRRPVGHVNSNRDGGARRVVLGKIIRHSNHRVYVPSVRRRSTRECFAHTNRARFCGRKADTPRHDVPHSPRLSWIDGLHLRELSDDCPENTGLVFAKNDEATGIVPLVARRCAIHIRRPLPFSAGCSF